MDNTGGEISGTVTGFPAFLTLSGILLFIVFTVIVAILPTIIFIVIIVLVIYGIMSLVSGSNQKYVEIEDMKGNISLISVN